MPTANGPTNFLQTTSIKKIKYTELRYFLLFYGCKTWNLTLRKAQRLRIFENLVLRKKYGIKTK